MFSQDINKIMFSSTSYNQFNSHLILFLNTISIKFIIAVKIDVKPHTILKFKFKDQLFYRISVEKWDKLVLAIANKLNGG